MNSARDTPPATGPIRTPEAYTAGSCSCTNHRGPAASAQHGSAFINPDNDDQTAARSWRLANATRLVRSAYIHWNVVPSYVSATGTNVNATPADGVEALAYLHQFVSLFPALRAVVVMGAFAEH
jgi:hypothetical protein